MAKAQKTPEELAAAQEAKAAKDAAKAEAQKKEQDAAAANAASTNSEAALAAAERNTAKALREGEQVVAFILPQNEQDKVCDVCVNGHWYHFPKGKLTKIPKTLEQIVRESEKMLDENDAMVRDLILQQQLKG